MTQFDDEPESPGSTVLGESFDASAVRDRSGVAAFVGLGFLLAVAALVRWRNREQDIG